MANITVSSNVLVDDGTTPVSRFSQITLSPADSQTLESLKDESSLRFGLGFAGSGLRAAHALLKSIEARVLVNGAPSMTLDGYLVAVAIGQGELVTLEIPVYQRGAAGDQEVISKTGIITNVVWSGGPGGKLAQRIDLVFHICHRLHIRASGNITTLTDPSVV